MTAAGPLKLSSPAHSQATVHFPGSVTQEVSNTVSKAVGRGVPATAAVRRSLMPQFAAIQTATQAASGAAAQAASPASPPPFVIAGTPVKVNQAGLKYLYTPHPNVVLGRGRCGMVVSGVEVVQVLCAKETVTAVAMKYCFNPRHAEREIALLQTVKDVAHALQLRNVYQASGCPVLVLPLLGANVRERYLTKGNYLDLTIVDFTKMAVGFFETLTQLREIGVIHTDLKPDNLVFDGKLTILDWGVAVRASDPKGTSCQPPQPPKYRAPEVFFGAAYDGAIDTWSVGIMLFELFTGKPLFQAKTAADCLVAILELLGLPPKALIQASSLKDQYFVEKDGEFVWKGVGGNAALGHPAKWAQIKADILQAAALRLADALKRGQAGMPADLGERFFALFRQIIAYQRSAPEVLLAHFKSFLSPSPVAKPVASLPAAS